MSPGGLVSFIYAPLQDVEKIYPDSIPSSLFPGEDHGGLMKTIGDCGWFTWIINTLTYGYKILL